MTQRQNEISAYLTKTFGISAMIHQIQELEKLMQGKRRSTQQNRSIFGIPYKMIAEALTQMWGEDVSVDTVHELMKQRFESILFEHSIKPYTPRTMPNKDTGEVEYIMPLMSTTKLTTVGAMKYYEAMQQFGAQFLSIDIPDPNEIPFEEWNKR